MFSHGTASYTGNMIICLETMSAPKLLSLSENVFVQSLSSPLIHTQLDAWLLLFTEELHLAHMMTRLQTLLSLDCGHAELEQVYN